MRTVKGNIMMRMIMYNYVNNYQRQAIPEFLDRQQHTALIIYHQMHEKQQGHHRHAMFLAKMHIVK